MHHYCTLFDRNYITRGIALHSSLLRHRKDFRIVILCLDEITHELLGKLDLPGVVLVSLPSLEAFDPELLRAKQNRTTVEYYFTCKPVLMRFIVEKYKDASRITYLDSDLFYFSDPSLLESEYSDAAVALTPHRFPPRLSERNQFGRFNAGWVSAGCADEGRRFIDWWRARCLEWCLLEVQEDRFGDQKYLNQVPDLFSRVIVLENPGANLAPWNLDGRHVQRSAQGVVVDGEPLVFFHFHGIRKVLWKLYDSGLLEYGLTLTPELLTNIFRPYVESIERWERRLREEVSGWQIVNDRPAGLRATAKRWKRALTVIAGGAALRVPRQVESSQFRGPYAS